MGHIYQSHSDIRKPGGFHTWVWYLIKKIIMIHPLAAFRTWARAEKLCRIPLGQGFAQKDPVRVWRKTAVRPRPPGVGRSWVPPAAPSAVLPSLPGAGVLRASFIPPQRTRELAEWLTGCCKRDLVKGPRLLRPLHFWEMAIM